MGEQLAVLISAGAAAGSGAGGETADLGGFTGWAADIMVSLGSAGVGLITLLETVFPPIPSEVVLPLAGYLAGQDQLSLPGVVTAATVGSLIGALVLYGLAARLGAERARRVIGRIPLMTEQDADRATDWFHRHGRIAVFTGRLVPGVRSLVSLPAGATRMPLLSFCVFTALGSVLWNSVLVGAGVALSSRWREVEKYSTVLDAVVIGAVVAVIAAGVVRKVRASRAARAERH